VRLKKTSEREQQERISLEKLKDSKVKVSEMIENMLEPNDKTADFHIENVWNNFKNSVNDTLQMNLKAERPTKKQRWMTDDILDLMTEIGIRIQSNIVGSIQK
ncbi:hypothetical protein HHI36_005358, partial [Cryptolaemus montrouzieri]